MGMCRPRPAARLLRSQFAAVLLGLALAASLAATASARAAITLAPFKDKLFGYGKVLAENADGSFAAIDYDEARDIDKRDEVPELRVWRNYVDLSVRRHERQLTVKGEGRSIAVDETGNPAGARFAVVFIHGRGGDRRLGSNDWTFGGNFNRIKNLAVRNGGVYVAPSVPSFDASGAARVAALIAHLAAASPQAEIVLSCASMGSLVCWRLTHDDATVRRLSGMMIMGGISDPGFLDSRAFHRKLPMFFSHGSRDKVYAWQDQKALFDHIRKASPGYPARMVLFITGTHGTPIRMTDWRRSLNWIFAQ